MGLKAKGTVDKSADYRDKLKQAVSKSHPVNNGVHMAAHHLVSREAVKTSKLGSVLVKKGYNINDVDNLVFLPATFQAACMLKVQLHRGDHTHRIGDERPYHAQVGKLLEKLKFEMKQCDTSSREIQDLVQEEVAEVALRKIAKFKVPLTAIYQHFDRREVTVLGCANLNDFQDIDASNETNQRLRPCTKQGEHHGDSNSLYPYGKKRKVTVEMNYESTLPYKLKC